MAPEVLKKIYDKADVKTFHSFGALSLSITMPTDAKFPANFKIFEAKSHIMIYIKRSYYM